MRFWILLLGLLAIAGPSWDEGVCPAASDSVDSCLAQRVERLERELKWAIIAFEAEICPAGWARVVQADPGNRGASVRGPIDLPIIYCRKF